jgi:phosphatidate cytidylyltransferase
MLRADAKTPNELIGVVGAACLPLATWIWGTGGMLTILFLLMLVLLVWYVFYQPARISDVAISLFGAMYTGLMMSAAMLLRMGIDGFWGGVLLLGIFASIWGNDAFAYLVGSKFGKHKMAPTISPKKSWEGFFGGMIFSVVAWLLMTQIPGLNMTFPIAVVMGIVCGFFGVLGDLVESRIKRNSGFKDSGTIMPGHGGLLDRCDSQFLVTVVAALGLFLTGCLPYVI